MEYPEIFNRVIEVVLRNEGGDAIVENPSDPGGLTRWGVSQRSYPLLDIRNLTKERAIDIYYQDYWLKGDFELLTNPDLILDLFDMSVNVGLRTAIKLLQRMVGTIDDGYIGQITTNAISSFEDDIVEEYKKRRKLFYVTLAQNKPTLRVFLKGWLARVDGCKFN
jgi:lysozyme family protein